MRDHLHDIDVPHMVPATPDKIGSGELLCLCVLALIFGASVVMLVWP